MELVLVVLTALVALLIWAWAREVRAHHELRRSLPDLERRVRNHAIKTSDGTRLGQLAEQLVPFLPQFRYDPQDAHFMGRPIDFVVFDGLCSGVLREVVFIEVKTGKSKRLDGRQQSVRECIDAGRVRFETLRVSSAGEVIGAPRS